VTRRSTVVALQITMGFLASGYGMTVTVLDDWRDRYGIAEGWLGFIVAIGFLTSFVAQTTIAPLADRGHTARMLFWGVGLNVVGLVAMGLGTSVAVIATGRLITGVGAGMAIPAVRRIVVVSDPERIGHNIGRGIALEVGGFALGPLLAALTVVRFGIATPFLILGVILIGAMWMLTRLDVPETPTADRTRETFALDLLAIRPLRGAVLIGLANFVSAGVFDSLWVVTLDDLSAPGWLGDAGFATFGLPWIVLATFGGAFAARQGPLRVGALGLGLGAFHVASYGLLDTPYVMYAIGISQSIIFALTVGGPGIAIARIAPPNRQSGAAGLLGGLQVLTAGVSALAAGVSYERFGRTPTFVLAAVIMFGLVVGGLALAGREWMRRPEPLSSVR